MQANPVGMDEPGNWFDSFWSPDDKFVVVPAYGHETLVNLQTDTDQIFFRICSPRKVPFERPLSWLVTRWKENGCRHLFDLHAR